MTKLDDIKPLRVGIDFDLVNISLLGYDPVTGRTYQECHYEWEAWKDELLARIEARRWWQVLAYFRHNYLASILTERLGMRI